MTTDVDLTTLVRWLSSQKSAQLYVTAKGTFRLRLLKNGRYGAPVCADTFEQIITIAMSESEPPTPTFLCAPKRYWKSPWGFKDEDPAPPREHFFPTVDDAGCWYAAQLNMEDFLQHNCVFYNLLNGRSCHSDSYMTGVADGNLIEAMNLLRETYRPTPTEIGRIADQWSGNPNMQPPLREVAIHFRHYDWAADNDSSAVTEASAQKHEN